MLYRISILLFCLSAVVFIMGCHVLPAEQKWSENYALLDGAQSTSPEMIDGDINTVGITKDIGAAGHKYGSTWGTAVSIRLPEKKYIRKIVIHSENVKKLSIYADKNGTALSETDWELIKEIKGAKSSPIVIPLFNFYPIDNLRIIVLDTSDDGALNRQDKADYYRDLEQRERSGDRPNQGKDGFRARTLYPGRINEIEIYGYKSAEETAAGKIDTQSEDELDAILE